MSATCLKNTTKIHASAPLESSKYRSIYLSLLQFCSIHCLISFRMTTPLNPPPGWFNVLTVSGPLVNKCLYWVIVPAAGFGGLVIIEMVGKGLLFHKLFELVNRCLSDSRFLDVWMLPFLFSWEELLVACFVLLMLELALGGFPGGWTRIWAEGFIRSSQRRIQFPRFRPTSMSLSCMLRWTLRATSKTARVRLWIGKGKTRKHRKQKSNVVTVTN